MKIIIILIRIYNGVEKKRNEKMDKKLNEINVEKNENKQNKIESENENEIIPYTNKQYLIFL